MNTTRKCKCCHKRLPATEQYFYRMKNCLRHTCKTCFKAQHTARCKAHPEYRKKQNKRYWDNVEYFRAYQRNRRKANPEHFKKWKRDWIQKNYEYIRPRIKARWHKRRALIQGNGGTYTELDIKCKLQLQGHRCYWCKTKFGKYTVDHYVPLTRGGSNWPSNIVLACQPCNSAKGNKMPEEFYAYLAQQRQLEFTV